MRIIFTRFFISAVGVKDAFIRYLLPLFKTTIIMSLHLASVRINHVLKLKLIHTRNNFKKLLIGVRCFHDVSFSVLTTLSSGGRSVNFLRYACAPLHATILFVNHTKALTFTSWLICVRSTSPCEETEKN
jgi:hypothetical protein